MPSASGPVLIVDDDDEIREALRESLELEGYAAVEAAHGGEALAYLATGARPSIILLDWNMAPMNALDFMHAVAKLDDAKTIPVVLVTADAHASRKVMSAGFAAYLKKPVKLQALFQTIAQLTAPVTP